MKIVYFLFLQQRLGSLAKFQLSVLNHALSFPFIKRVVYSTCSVHQQVFVLITINFFDNKYILLDVLLCSIAEYFYELGRILASP